MIEKAKPKELSKEIKTTDTYQFAAKSPQLKGSSTHKGKLNYHKIKQKSKAYSGYSQNNYEINSVDSCEGKKVPCGNTPSQMTEISSRRIESINKNKTFKEDIVNDNKEMYRALSHISFTNQTEMFDNYDSNNSHGNCKGTGEIRIHDIDDDDDDENLPIDVEDEGINICSNSFLNLTTNKNKFFNKSTSSEHECPNVNDEHEEYTNKSMADLILKSEGYNNASFENKVRTTYIPARNKQDKENTQSKYFEKEEWMNSFEGSIIKNQTSRNDLQFEERKNTKNETTPKLTQFEDYSSVLTCMVKCSPMEINSTCKDNLKKTNQEENSFNDSYNGPPSIRSRYISP